MKGFMTGITVVMAIYILANVSYFAILSKEELSTSGAVAVVK